MILEDGKKDCHYLKKEIVHDSGTVVSKTENRVRILAMTVKLVRILAVVLIQIQIWALLVDQFEFAYEWELGSNL